MDEDERVLPPDELEAMLVDEDGHMCPHVASYLPVQGATPANILGTLPSPLWRRQQRLRDEGGRRQGRAGMQPLLPLPPGAFSMSFCFLSV